MFQKKAVDKIKFRFKFSKFFLENRSVYYIMWKNIIQPDRLQMGIRRMRIVCWITKTTNAKSEYVMRFVLFLMKASPCVCNSINVIQYISAQSFLFFSKVTCFD